MPLVEAWRAERILVEAWIDEQGPLLFAIDSATQGAALSPALVNLLKLPLSRAGVEVQHLELGDLHLGPVTMGLLPAEGDAPYHEISLAGVLGSLLFERGALEIDPGAGLLRLYQSAPPPPEGAQRLGRGTRAWEPEISLNGASRRFILSTGRGHHTLKKAPPEEEAKALLLEGEAVAWSAELEWLGKAPERLAFRRGPRDLLGYPLLWGQVLRFGSKSLYSWPAQGEERLSRFDDLPNCGPRFERCFRGSVLGVREGRVDLLFEPAPLPLPPRYWLRVDFGLEQPQTILLRSEPRFGPLQSSLERPGINPEELRSPGTALSVLDVIPYRPCHGALCLL